ncbi:hypothetical protein GCM10028857_13420 [Salinarchaeum chitinilyticum]
MGERVQINLLVNEEQKAEWEDYVEESREYSSLSQLIRSGVEAEINRDSESTPSSSPALSTDIQELKEDLDRVRKDVRWLREQEQDEVDISDLAQTLYDGLEPLPEPTSEIDVPEDADPQQHRRQVAAVQVIDPSGPDGERSPQTTRALADRLGADESRIEDAIEHLEDNFLPIVSVEIQGQTHYFKEE